MLELQGGSQAAAAHLDSLRQIGAISVGADGIKEIANSMQEMQGELEAK